MVWLPGEEAGRPVFTRPFAAMPASSAPLGLLLLVVHPHVLEKAVRSALQRPGWRGPTHALGPGSPPRKTEGLDLDAERIDQAAAGMSLGIDPR